MKAERRGLEEPEAGRDGWGLEKHLAALSGDRAALGELVACLTPVIQKRVSMRLRISDPNLRTREAVEDLTQEIFACLFDDGAKILRRWDPGLGSIKHYVGFVAQLRVCSILRPARQRPWREDAILDEQFDRPSQRADPERRASARQRLRLLLECFDTELGARDWLLFQGIFLDERTAVDVGRELGMTPPAVHQWVRRFRKKLRRLAIELGLDHPFPEPGEDGRK
jgi:RNA polymerase sigma factor (sigma-70 family)